MSSYQIVMDAVELKTPERTPVVPLVMKFAAKYSGVPYSIYCQDYSKMAQAQAKCARAFKYDLVTVCSDAYREASALGSKVDFPYDDVPLCKEALVKTKEDFSKLSFPDVRKATRTLDRIKGVEALKKEVKGELPVFGWIEAPFQETSIIHNLTNTMNDVYRNPDFIKEMLGFVADMEIEFGLAQIDAGADIIGAGDAVASMISPKHYKEFALPYIKKVFGRLRAAGAKTKYHLCGNATHLIDLIGEINASIVNFDYFVDLKEAKKRIGGKVCIKGNIDPVSVLMQGTPDKIRSACKKCIGDAGPGGFLLSPGCEVPAATPHENMIAMAESAKA